MFQQWKPDSKELLPFKHTLYHRRTEYSVSKDEVFILRHNSKTYISKGTKGWEFLLKRDNGTMPWDQLIDIKESYISEVSKYTDVDRIIDRPAFSWWDMFVLKKRKIIL